MAESRLWAPDLEAQLGVSSCLRKCQRSSPDARRQQPFSGKSFYLDLPAGKTLQFLTESIQQLGGVIEGFLSREVSCIVSSRREAKAGSSGTSHRSCSSSSPGEVSADAPPMDPKGSHPGPSQKPVDLAPLSRGKELLQKAIRNQGSSSGGGGGSPGLLTSARSWGVKILHVDEMVVRVQQLSLDALCVKKQEPRKPEGARPAEAGTRKVARLKAPFLKIEDESRRFRPFHHQFKSFPELSLLGPKDASPFEAPTLPGSSRHPRGRKDREPRPRPDARAVPRRRRGYCECCQQAFEELPGHLQSARHQAFALKARPYAAVDRLIAQLGHSSGETPLPASLPRQPGSTASDRPALPPGQPSCGGAAAPRRREEDGQPAPGVHQQEGPAGGGKSPAARAGAGERLGPAASCQDLGGSGDIVVDPRGAVLTGSPTSRCLLSSSDFADLSSGPDPARVGHKRKVRLPSGNAGKRPGVSLPVSGALGPCGPGTAGGRHLVSLPLPGPEARPLTSPLPSCYPQTSLSLPDAFPWRHPDGPPELWATQPAWPGGGDPPASEASECAAPGPGPPQADRPPTPRRPPAHLHSAAGT